MAEKKAPAFGRPKDWDKMTPEQKREWAKELLAKASGSEEKSSGQSS